MTPALATTRADRARADRARADRARADRARADRARAARTRLYEPSDTFRTLVREGRDLADAGDLGAAERFFEDALLSVRGVNRAAETYALASLMTVYQRSWRTVETLALGRFLADRLYAGGEVAKAAGCLATFASGTMTLGLRDRTDAALEELARWNARVPVSANTMAHETLHDLSAALAARRGATARAMAHLARFRAIEPIGEARAGRKPMQDAYLEGLIALSRNDPDAALADLGRAHDLAPERESRLGNRRARLEARLMTGDRNRALREALALLRDVEALVDEPHTASLRIDLGTWLAPWLDNQGADLPAVHRAYDQAAGAVIERIHQLDRALDRLPELGHAGVRALEELVRVRRTFVADQRALMQRVAEFLHTTDGGVAADLLYGDRRDGYVRICAGCESVSRGGGRWLPVGHLVPRGPAGLRVTHGICPACAAGAW